MSVHFAEIGRRDARLAAELIIIGGRLGGGPSLRCILETTVSRQVAELIVLGATPAERKAWLGAFQQAAPEALSSVLRPARSPSSGAATPSLASSKGSHHAS